MWDTPLTPGRWVHMLEHGAVAVLYRPDLCDNNCVQQLGDFYDSAPRSNLVGIRHLVITPYQDMDHAVGWSPGGMSTRWIRSTKTASRLTSSQRSTRRP